MDGKYAYGKIFFIYTYIFIFFYLLIFGCTASLLLLGFFLVAAGRAYSLAAVCRLLIAVASLITEQGLYGTWASAVVAYGLSHCRSRTLEHRFNNVVHGLGCSVACVIFPNQGSNHCLLYWQVDSSPPSH